MHNAFYDVAFSGSFGKTAMNGIIKNADLVPYISEDLQVISFTLQNEKDT